MKPILLHGRSVRGILADRKTQTRRIIKDMIPEPGTAHPHKLERTGALWQWTEKLDDNLYHPTGPHMTCPHGEPGDVLWVRETWRANWLDRWAPGDDEPPQCGIEYRADGTEIAQKVPEDWYEKASSWGEKHGLGWRPSIHMPKWACRLFLRVLDVRVERVQEASVLDIMAEGIRPNHPDELFENKDEHDRAYRQHWKRLWNDTNSHRLDEYGWDQNPWVWVVEFERLEDA